MYTILLIFHVILAIVLVSIILIQHGKGAQAGAAFGSGASQTVFGSQGSGGFLSQMTGVLAAVFFALNLFLAYWVNKSSHPAYFERHPSAPTLTVNPEAGKQVPQQGEKPAGTTDVPDVN